MKTVKIPADLHAAVVAFADNRGMKLQAVLARALAAGLKQMKAAA